MTKSKITIICLFLVLTIIIILTVIYISVNYITFDTISYQVVGDNNIIYYQSDQDWQVPI